MRNSFSIAISAAYVLLMWRHDGPQSALLLCAPLGLLVMLIYKAETAARYTGWAGRVPIRRRSPASLIRAFAWIVLLAPGAIILWQQLPQ